MNNMRFVYGPVPSRRLGISLGISPIPKKSCNYSCIYCQLGRTDKMSNRREMFFPVEEIMLEVNEVLEKDIFFDVITIVGEGEPTLYAGLGELIFRIKAKTNKPVAVITNGALLYDKVLRQELSQADIVMPSFDAYEEELWKKINRPVGTIDFAKVIEGLVTFSQEYQGQLWLEIMFMAGINDSEKALLKFRQALKKIKYSRLYLNTTARPPAEAEVKAISNEQMNRISAFLLGISIELLVSQGFHSEIKDDYEAIISIIKRHPMNQFEIKSFLKTRNCEKIDGILAMLELSENINVIKYRGFSTYRLK